MGMLVGFSGVGGTGKTTTANDVVEKLNLTQQEQEGSAFKFPWKTAPSVVRPILKKFKVNSEIEQRDMPPQVVFQMQNEILHAKLDQDEKLLRDTAAHYVVDRTPMDHFVYGLHHAGWAMDSNQVEDWIKRIRFGMLRYSLICTFELVEFSADDGVRSTAFGYRSSIYLGMISAWNHFIGFTGDPGLGTTDQAARTQKIINKIALLQLEWEVRNKLPLA